MNHPAGRPSAYYAALRDEEDAVSDALACIRAEEDERRITAVQAAAERISLLEGHLVRLAKIRLEHLGGTP
jgi:hypothetical protein